MASLRTEGNLIHFTQSRGPTIDGKKLFMKLSKEEKEAIVRKVQQDWRELITLHFEAEGGILKGGQIRKWRDLNDDYARWKENKFLLPGLLEASQPTLMERYKRSIKSKVTDKGIEMWIEFPKLVTGPSRQSSHPADAGVHQLGKTQRGMNSTGSGKLGTVKRKIIMSSFNLAYKKRILEALIGGNK